MQERPGLSIPALPIIAAEAVLLSLAVWSISRVGVGPSAFESAGVPAILAIVVFVAAVIIASGFVVIQPNQSRVITFLGTYLGTVRESGWRWTLPLTSKETVSLRIANFDSEMLKVNDAVGNPVEISAVIVWRIIDTAKAVFSVEDYGNFIAIQTETAVRHVASYYPYDTYEEGKASLRANADQVTETLHTELQEHLETAGIEVMRTQLRRLAYAPEIAADMLRRQQAEAVVAARSRIVDGAVGMVQAALEQLSANDIVVLDEERKAAMVSNLLVVLCSEHHAQPVINAGTLYS
ncbi:MAG: SPFH domain-containing protein [Actinomycetota bacterium]